MVSRLDLRRLELIFVDSPRVSGILGVFIEQRGDAGGQQGGHNPPRCSWVVPPSGHPSGTSSAHLVSSGPEKIHKEFRCVWTPFDIGFMQCKKQAENNNCHWALYQ